MKRILCVFLCLLLLCGCAPEPEISTVADTTTSTTYTTTATTVTTTASQTTTTVIPSSGTTSASTKTPTSGQTTTSTTQKPTTTTAPTTTVSAPVPTDEVQAVWVASIINLDFPSKPGLSAAELKRECDTIIANVKAMGLNTVYFQVRPSGDALYRSEIFPSSAYIVEQQGDPLPVDLLAYMLDIAHDAGLKLYAWVNPVRAKHSVKETLHASNPAAIHPEWTSVCADGRVYYNLGLPEVRRLIADGVAEIVQNYAVDGVIFDDYFYPYPSGAAGFDDSAAYATYGAGKSLAEFRRTSVNQLIRACYNRVKAERSSCLFGVAPFGIRLNSDAGTNGMEAYSAIYCDAAAWIKGEYIDFIEPQLYWACDDPSAPFQPLADYWAKTVSGTDVSLRMALAPYKYTEGNFTAGEITRQVTYGRGSKGYEGCSLFRYRFLLSDQTETKHLFQ